MKAPLSTLGNGNGHTMSSFLLSSTLRSMGTMRSLGTLRSGTMRSGAGTMITMGGSATSTLKTVGREGSEELLVQ